jgi:hypothetical protein
MPFNAGGGAQMALDPFPAHPGFEQTDKDKGAGKDHDHIHEKRTGIAADRDSRIKSGGMGRRYKQSKCPACRNPCRGLRVHGRISP